MKKYEFTGERKQIELSFKTVTLHRIRAVVDFGFIKAGDLGGWIEKEENLSHSGNARIYGNARICDNAKIYGNAKIFSVNYALVYRAAVEVAKLQIDLSGESPESGKNE